VRVLYSSQANEHLLGRGRGGCHSWETWGGNKMKPLLKGFHHKGTGEKRQGFALGRGGDLKGIFTRSAERGYLEFGIQE